MALISTTLGVFPWRESGFLVDFLPQNFLVDFLQNAVGIDGLALQAGRMAPPSSRMAPTSPVLSEDDDVLRSPERSSRVPKVGGLSSVVKRLNLAV